MLHKLIIVADLQHLKIFISKTDPVGHEFLELQENTISLQNMNKKSSSYKGIFKSSCEGRFCADHSIAEKEECQRIREIVEEISYVLQEYKNEKWYFAAPKAINEQIIGLLDVSLKGNMAVNLCLEVFSDLSLLPSSKYL